VNELVSWLFAPPAIPVSAVDVIRWWERRRVLYNALVLGAGAVALAVYYAAIITSGTLPEGEDAVEPLALIVAPIAVNLCYTAGWFVEAPLRALAPRLTPRFGPVLFGVGLGFSLLLVAAPGIWWGVYRVLQLLHAVV
jgi:4-amino-4-deoxy-L-arabinose transferase-like glycosyltransferase